MATGNGGFRDRLSAAAGVDSPASDVAAPSVAGAAFLAVQEVDFGADPSTRRRAVQKGEAILGALDELRLEMLQGSVTKDRLTILSTLLKVPSETIGDAETDALLDAIRLRLAIEVAKLEARRTDAEEPWPGGLTGGSFRVPS